jgi:hypothetical protein
MYVTRCEINKLAKFITLYWCDEWLRTYFIFMERKGPSLIKGQNMVRWFIFDILKSSHFTLIKILAIIIITL